MRTANIMASGFVSCLSESAEEDELDEPVGSMSLTSPEPPSSAPRKGSKGTKMSDNYDVENQGRRETLPAMTTSLIEKPDIDKKVKVSLPSSVLAWLIGVLCA
jgi:hypothetical protein